MADERGDGYKVIVPPNCSGIKVRPLVGRKNEVEPALRAPDFHAAGEVRDPAAISRALSTPTTRTHPGLPSSSRLRFRTRG